jgi:hypothetical protein
MKKNILTIGILFMCLSSQAQFYLKGYTGYSVSAGDEQAYYSQIANGIMDGVSTDMKFGQGLNIGLSTGYSFSKNIALEITGNTQLFSGLNFSVEPDFGSPKNGGLDWRSEGVYGKSKTTNQIIQFAPQLVFSSNSYGNWIFYLKGGPDFLYAKFTSSLNQDSYQLEYLWSSSKSFKQKYSGGINIGTQFSAGTEYSLQENIQLFAEITTINVRYNFKKYKILQYEIGGVDWMPDLESVSGEKDNKVNFNHFGLNIGIKYIFGK